MPVDAFMFFGKSSSGAVIEGESSDAFATDEKGKQLKPFEIISFEWGAHIGKKEKKKKKDKDGKEISTDESDSDDDVSETKAHREITVESFKISKPFDSASCGLFTAATNPNCVFEEATVVFRKSGGGEPFIYLKFVFKKVQIDAVDWKIEGSEGDKPDQEDVKCSFQQCDIFYSPQTEKGSKQLSFGGTQKKTATYKRTELDGEPD